MWIIPRRWPRGSKEYTAIRSLQHAEVVQGSRNGGYCVCCPPAFSHQIASAAAATDPLGQRGFSSTGWHFASPHRCAPAPTASWTGGVCLRCYRLISTEE